MTAFRSFADALHTQAPAPDRADGMGLYGWLVGDWEMDAVILLDDGSMKGCAFLSEAPMRRRSS